ncbi:MAG TPA: YdcF family protein [Acidimicrobiales bacterium]|nr:YdcF family protein [Acidimicrobiales bacterium]
MRFAVKVVAGLLAAVVLYLGVTFLQVWRAARADQARPAEAIVVFGTAQYNGVPSPVLAARLDHAIRLYRKGFAPVIVVTGGNQPGDEFTEATASANYLIERGVPDEDVLREVSGTSSWQSLAAAASFLDDRDITEVLLVSDPFHSLRIRAMASELGLQAHASPTRTSPIKGVAEARYMVRETVAVAVGRITGFRRQASIEDVVKSRG